MAPRSGNEDVAERALAEVNARVPKVAARKARKAKARKADDDADEGAKKAKRARRARKARKVVDEGGARGRARNGKGGARIAEDADENRRHADSGWFSTKH